MADLRPAISQLCGWIYFTLWSLSFYPQPILNIKNQSTAGLVFDYPLLNFLGFICYTTGTAAFLYSPTIREQYAARHPASPQPTVRFNDLCFGINAVVFCAITVSQFWPRLWGFKHDANRRTNAVTRSVGAASLLAVAASTFLVIATPKQEVISQHEWEWIDVIYTLTFVKLGVTVFKYIPQAISNYRRKSTMGWAITPMLLDAGGSVFSLTQLVVDCSMQADWTGLLGNPVKLGLANVSLLADLVFITQHFVLYRHAEDAGSLPERDVLLGG